MSPLFTLRQLWDSVLDLFVDRPTAYRVFVTLTFLPLLALGMVVGAVAGALHALVEYLDAMRDGQP